MTLFFDSYPKNLAVTLEEILPRPDTNPKIAHRAVYAGLIRKLHTLVAAEVRDLAETLLRPARLRAERGALRDADFSALLEHFEFFRAECRARYAPFTAYKSTNGLAAQIAMLLFVDNVLKQGLGALAHADNAKTQNQLAETIMACHREQGLDLHPDNARFYAAYFLWQTVFDKIFVGDEECVSHAADGSLHVTSAYQEYTGYLRLANQRLVMAGDAERALSYAITTGWREGIDVDTWNELNRDYYSRSDDNFFSNDYDDHLDKMLPQFPLGKARAAADVVAAWSGENELDLIEIGAGSGSFAIDLYFAIQQQGKPLARFRYRGLEPAGEMMAVFRDHFRKRTGQEPPAGWTIEETGLEGFLERYASYLAADGENQLVFSYSAHHCYRGSLNRLVHDPRIQAAVSMIYILDGTREHGWTKWTYMPLDCRSPEDFDNVALTGPWRSETLWHEPHAPLPHHAVSTAWSALRRLTPPAEHLFGDEDPAFLIDLDGTLYRGQDAIPGAIEFLITLREWGLRFMLLTNRSERSPKTIAAHLARLGFEGMDPADILTSATATAAAFEPAGAYWIGGEGLAEALQEAGFHWDEKAPRYVIVGLDRELTYAKLQRAVDLVVHGAQFIATNVDKRINTEQGFAPGCGALVAAIATATGATPIAIGKPERALFDQAVARLGVPQSQVFVIGDSLATDILGGRAAGLRTILTLTGVDSLATSIDAQVQPDLVIEQLTDLLPYL